METSAMSPLSKTGPHGQNRLCWPAWALHVFPVVQTSASRVFRLESEVEYDFMPIAISASSFRLNGCRSLRIPKRLSFAAGVALFMSAARLHLKAKSWRGRYCDSDSICAWIPTVSFD